MAPRASFPSVKLIFLADSYNSRGQARNEADQGKGQACMRHCDGRESDLCPGNLTKEFSGIAYRAKV